jgi:23S rRNA pseudouridine1911/1915/1917 synthase
MSDRVSLRVTEAEEGERLDRLLADRLPELSRNRVQKAFAAGEVTVDGRPRPKSFRPGAGSEIMLVIPEAATTTLAAQDIPLDVLHEDEHLLVINKPPGLVVHPGPGHPDGTLVNALLHRGRDLADTGDPLRPGIVHRLDRETSGLLVVARTPAAHGTLAAQLRDHSLGRRYLDLSWGSWPEREGVLEGAIGRHPRDRQRMAVVTRRGRKAITRYRVLDDLEFVQLCSVQLTTGRTHQIRVHFTHHGHPVVGDPLYGDDRRARNVRPVDRQAAARLVSAAPRQLLHAAELRLRHPVAGTEMVFQAPLPEDFAAALRGLRQDLRRPLVGPETSA